MNTYARIAQAIEFLQQQRHQQPTLAEVAAHVHLSPAHFQRLFSQWAGVSPKKLLQVLTLEAAKQQLRQQPGAEPEGASSALSLIAANTGLSTASRLYDHFVQLEAVTPGEYRQGGEGMEFVYGRLDTFYGTLVAVLSTRGIHRLHFADAADAMGPVQESLQADWPRARLIENDNHIRMQLSALLQPLAHYSATPRPLSLWVKGTNFQINVWRALLQIQPGQVSSYRTLARHIGQPKAARAVGHAIGANPVALLIPCHRVLKQSGALGGYRWGPVRKQAILAREQARSSQNHATRTALN